MSLTASSRVIVPDADLSYFALRARGEILRLWRHNRAPLSGSFSVVELYTLVYAELLSAGAPEPLRFIPKTTSANTIYGVTRALGFAAEDDAMRSRLPPIPQQGEGAAASCLKLGTSIYQALGLAHAAKRGGRPGHVLAVLSDGELQCGVDHAAKLAAAWGLDNLVVVIDHNGLQSAYPVNLVDPTLEPGVGKSLPRLRNAWEAYGWSYREIDGHDFAELRAGLHAAFVDATPAVVVAHTIKGKGLPYAEGDIRYNHELPEEQAIQAEGELRRQLRGRRRPPALRRTGLPVVEPRWSGSPALPTMKPPSTHRLRTVFAEWLEQFCQLNPKRVLPLNTDNPLPFRPDGGRFDRLAELTTTVGINERGAVNIARGLSIEGVFPVYVSPAAHLTSCAEEFAHCALDRQRVLVVGMMPGSELASWGASHTSYRDVQLFAAAGAHIFQPACSHDLVMILDGIYSDPETFLPSYLRLPRWARVPLEAVSGTDSRRPFEEGCYSVTYGKGDPKIVFVTSGVVTETALIAARALQARLDVTTRVVNVLRLFGIPPAIAAAIGNAHVIISAIDADPATLAAPLFELLPNALRSGVDPVGVREQPPLVRSNEALVFSGLDATSLERRAFDRWSEMSSRAKRRAPTVPA